MKKIIITERIADEAVELLKENFAVDICLDDSREELLDKIQDYDGIIIRSATQIDEELMAKATKLKMVGRAGNGTDNIDIRGATERGIIVANTPESNTMSAAELTIGLLVAQSRNIPQANTLLKAKKWGRNQFKGSELYQKTLGIVGLGRIGSLVAKRMDAFGMKVIAYDPYISEDRFSRYGVEKKEKLEELVRESDYITVHTPRNKETLGMINETHLPIMKDGVRLTNVARGGIIKEATILAGIKSGKIASAGIDVHETEPTKNFELLKFENVIVTPHLGASTLEAQINVGMTVASQVVSGLKGEIVPNAVNLPAIHRDELVAIKPYIELAEKLGKIYYQLNEEPIDLIKAEYFGEIGKQDTSMITISFVKGLLETIISHRVNYVNAMLIARQRGITVEDKSYEEHYSGFTNYVKITVTNKNGNFVLGGNLSSNKEGRLVYFDGYEVDITPGKNMIILRNLDVPGTVGLVGTILGEEKVNIASMQLGRTCIGGNALMLLNIDGEATEKTISNLTANEKVLWAKGISL